MSERLNHESLGRILSLLRFGGYTCPTRRIILAEQLLATRNVEGAVIEVGCNMGQTSCWIEFILRNFLKSDKEFHVYDGFIGIRGRTKADERTDGGYMYPEGSYKAKPQRLLDNFKLNGLNPPTIHHGLAHEFRPKDIPDKISMAFFDMDLYQPTKDMLKLVWPKMNPDGIMVFDDYGLDLYPGIKKLVDEFVKEHDLPLQVHERNITGVVKCRPSGKTSET